MLSKWGGIKYVFKTTGVAASSGKPMSVPKGSNWSLPMGGEAEFLASWTWPNLQVNFASELSPCAAWPGTGHGMFP